MQQGMAAKKEDDADAAERMFAAAARFYKQAAEMYPPDDECFPCTSIRPLHSPITRRTAHPRVSAVGERASDRDAAH